MSLSPQLHLASDQKICNDLPLCSTSLFLICVFLHCSGTEQAILGEGHSFTGWDSCNLASIPLGWHMFNLWCFLPPGAFVVPLHSCWQTQDWGSLDGSKASSGWLCLTLSLSPGCPVVHPSIEMQAVLLNIIPLIRKLNQLTTSGPLSSPWEIYPLSCCPRNFNSLPLQHPVFTLLPGGATLAAIFHFTFFRWWQLCRFLTLTIQKTRAKSSEC